jgi:o-succinylbenzoate---CoA ligase
MTELFRNKYRIPSARLKTWNYGDAGLYFITICTAGRDCYFGHIENGTVNLTEIGRVAENEWMKTPELRPEMNLKMGNFIVMPNHIHGIILIGHNSGRDAMHGLSDKHGDNPESIIDHNNKRDAMHGLSDKHGDNPESIIDHNNKRDAMHGLSDKHGDNPESIIDHNNKRDAMHGVSTGGHNQFGPQRKNLASIIRGFKSAVTTYARKHKILFDWQTRFHDHIIRSGDEYVRISKYIAENPIKWEQDKFFVARRDAMHGVSDKPVNIPESISGTDKNKYALHGVYTGMDDFIKQWKSDIDYFALQTSGSTGKPKQIRVSRQSMVRSAKLTGQVLDLKKGDTALLCMPLEFVAGRMMLIRALVLGLNLVVVKPTSNPLKELSSETFIDFAAMTPMQVQETLKESETFKKLRQIKKLIIGGAPVSRQLENELQQLPGDIFETYGMTETLTHIALRIINGSKRSEFFSVLPGIKISTDNRGCLIIHAPHLDEPEVITNDLVEIISPTQFRWLGRADNVINSGGIKIFPEQLEKKLQNLIKERFILTGIPDGKLGEKLVLVIETSNPGRFETLTELLSETLGSYEKPRELIFLEKFPETSTGKIMRREIQKLLKA